ncbi:hypothetical protein H0H81_002096 [Sphagnurus paluster]|uniref:peptidyl-tRNA hydrolase n=1 Tax=Sphagnurus paluster TaxID=117069 RepID=A0A9P7FZN7_9AGAR|nr:hypothetical protein H0H81_002096 [Sphagnurus paluster]
MPGVAIPRVLVVGLGNLPFPNTRHSIGQVIVDSLALRLGINMSAERNGISGNGNVLVGETMIALHLFKSKALMNISGPSIAAAYRKTVTSPTSLVVLSDSLSHKIETLHVRVGGSANGHNGIKSIISALGGEMDFYRFRVGIGRDETDAATYVMRKVSSHEHQFWNNQGLDLIISQIEKVALKS